MRSKFFDREIDQACRYCAIGTPNVDQDFVLCPSGGSWRRRIAAPLFGTIRCGGRSAGPKLPPEITGRRTLSCK